MRVTNSTNRLSASRQLRLVLWAALLASVCLAGAASTVVAGKPEYMKLKLKVGQALEIKGYWDTSGVFVATDIEELPRPRKPKLRGEIQEIDFKDKTITMYGQQIRVRDKTEFVEDGSEKVTFGKLKVGQRIEVSCKVTKEGQWKATKIKAWGVKKSDKIKGTVTRLWVDGKPPDTLEISRKHWAEKGETPDTLDIPGIFILLVPETDVDDPTSHLDQIEKELFGDLSRGSTMGLTEGVRLNGEIFVSGEYRQNFRSERDYDLRDDTLYALPQRPFENDQDDTEQDVRLEASGYWNQHVRAFAQLRYRKRYMIASDKSLPSREARLQFTQLYLLARNIGGRGLTLQIGRQDFDEPREWLYDEYLDAVRVFYYGTEPLLFEGALIHAVAPMKQKSRTWTDFFGSVRWYRDRESYFSVYVLSRRDSDEIRNRQPVWWGLRYYGLVKQTVYSWVDLAIMRGEDKHKPLRASAIDIGATIIARDVNLTPSATLAYAVATGDDTGGDPTDHRFRQTGYDDNVDRFGGVTSFSYYGTVLDPELSNLKIFTVGVGIRPTDKSSVDVVYHSYRQHELDNDIKGSDLVPPPFGYSADIGWALDLVIGLPKLWRYVRLKWTLGIFRPGEAFHPLYLEDAFLSKVNVKIGF